MKTVGLSGKQVKRGAWKPPSSLGCESRESGQPCMVRPLSGLFHTIELRKLSLHSKKWHPAREILKLSGVQKSMDPSSLPCLLWRFFLQKRRHVIHLLLSKFHRYFAVLKMLYALRESSNAKQRTRKADRLVSFSMLCNSAQLHNRTFFLRSREAVPLLGPLGVQALDLLVAVLWRYRVRDQVVRLGYHQWRRVRINLSMPCTSGLKAGVEKASSVCVHHNRWSEPWTAQYDVHGFFLMQYFDAFVSPPPHVPFFRHQHSSQFSNQCGTSIWCCQVCQCRWIFASYGVLRAVFVFDFFCLTCHIH